MCYWMKLVLHFCTCAADAKTTGMVLKILIVCDGSLTHTTNTIYDKHVR